MLILAKIPLPSKTPPVLRTEILDLIKTLRHDLPDLTPRRFLRHPAVLAHLRNRFPDVPNPTLGGLHPSLANRDHLRAYITQIQDKLFPHGMDWKGGSKISFEFGGA